MKHESMEQTARYWVGQDKQERYMWKGTLKRFSLTQERGHDGRIREVLQEDAVSAIKKATPQKNVLFFSDFSWCFKMLPLLFELLNHLHKRPFQLGKCINKATRTHRPLSKDLYFSKKPYCVFGTDCLPKPQERFQKG